MSRVLQPRTHAGRWREFLAVVHHAQLLQRGIHFGRGVEHGEISAPAVRTFRLCLLQVGAIGQHHHQQFAGGLRGIDGPSEAFTHQARQQTAVVEMRMAKHHEREFFGTERPKGAVALVKTTATLEQTAIQQKLVFTHREVVTGTGDLTGSTAELQFQDDLLS